MTDVLPPTPAGIARAAELLRGGAVVAFPTDTVYGVAVASRQRLPDLFALKQRPIEKRIPMLVADLSQVTGADDRARILAEHFWPGALTLVLPGSDASQAFRAPDHPVALDLIRATGPIFATSANRSSEPDTLGADDVLIAFATQSDELAAILDGGAVPGGIPSTVVDLSVTPARILREGPITREQLEALIDLVP